MTARFRTGLVVGKFSPLHLGHERLIGAAEAACERVVVLSYSLPEFPRCDADARERWLALRHPHVRAVVLDDARLAARCRAAGVTPMTVPHNDADAEAHRAFCARVLIGLLHECVDAVFTSEDYGDGFADALTAAYRATGAPLSHRVVHVSVDPARATVPVSGTALRADLAAHRHLVSADVRADLVPRLCLLGGESSGKTTLARALAARLGTAWVAEYGRERYEALRDANALPANGVLPLGELARIGEEQVAREREAAAHATGWLVCDTSPLTTLVYALLDHGDAPESLRSLARRRYDAVFLCEPDFAFVQDGTRRDEAFASRQMALTLSQLEEASLRWEPLRGPVDERFRAVVDRIG